MIRLTLTLSAIYLAAVGVGLMFFPLQFGIGAVPPDASPELRALLRLLGGPFLGIAVLNWLSRDADPKRLRAVLIANIVGFGTVAANDIVGVVTGPRGSPEPGVWVIAETDDLPTKFYKIVVTDDQGRYAIPDLPKGNYQVWTRGYGLIDGLKVRAAPGSTVNLLTGREASPREAAEIYPSMYWFSLLKVPAASEFPLGPVQSQQQWLNTIKSGACQSCHAIGTPGMRHVP
jgi:hypothetical protein